MNEKLLEHAKQFIFSPLNFEWTHEEERIINQIFTNTKGRVFFIYNSIPVSMITVLFAIYSRLKNPRGIRGVFVDNFLPQVLSNFVPECEKDYECNPIKFLKQKKIDKLDEFINYSRETKQIYLEFLNKIKCDPGYLEKITGAEKMRGFLATWLDKYGHNSIARPAMFYVCFEQISILAAKSIEWVRPGAGYIELSTRYVNMSGMDVYPIENELAEFGLNKDIAQQNIKESFVAYRYLQGENFDGPLPYFLREHYRDKIGDEKSLEQGVIGETCDVLGNLLPCATLTALGIGISGESLPELIKHLKLDGTPENEAIIELFNLGAKKVGASQFIRHIDLSEWRKTEWEYLAEKNEQRRHLFAREYVEQILFESIASKQSFSECKAWNEIVAKLKSIERSDFDKLFCEFEKISVSFQDVMTFRGWRDLQRMGFCAHHRGRVTPKLGFYKYNKPAPAELKDVFDKVHRINFELYNEMETKKVSDNLKEYPMVMGNLISFAMSANLRQWEFVNWQRSKPTVNHEVRQIILKFENALRDKYPWWKDLSRADMVGGYIFARGDKLISLN